MIRTVQMILRDAAEGDPQALLGLIDYLLDQNIPLSRIISIAEVFFGIPKDVCLETFEYFC